MSKSSRSHVSLLLRVCRADGSVDEHYAVPGITIGRSKANTIILAGDLSVDSVHHARVDVGGSGSLYLRCPNANTALEIDGRLCRGVALTAGVKVRIGNTEIECVSGAAVSPRPVTVASSACPFCQNSQVPLNGAAPRPCPACGKSLLPIPPIDSRGTPTLVPTDLDGFHAEKFVMRGGMGIVLRGTVDRSGTNRRTEIPARPAWLKRRGTVDRSGTNRNSIHARSVAIKILEACEVGESSTLARFRQEIELLSRVQHPNVVRPIASGNVAGFDYLVMEWIEGGSMRDMLDRAKRKGELVSFDDASKWFKEVAHGLEAIHYAGVIHRDVKPSNILIGPNRVAQIADLGIAKPIADADRSLTTTGQQLGTSDYMAPELRSFPDLIDPSTDLYALGVTFFEVLTGRLPVGLWRPINEFNGTVPDSFNTILMKMISQRKEDRFATAAEVIAAVEQVTTESVVAVPPALPTTTTPTSWLVKRVKAIQAAVTIAIASLVGSCFHSPEQVGKRLALEPSKSISRSIGLRRPPASSPILPGTKYELQTPGALPKYNPTLQQPGSKLTPNPNSPESQNFTGRTAAHAFQAGQKGQLSSSGRGSQESARQKTIPTADEITPAERKRLEEQLTSLTSQIFMSKATEEMAQLYEERAEVLEKLGHLERALEDRRKARIVRPSAP